MTLIERLRKSKPGLVLEVPALIKGMGEKTTLTVLENEPTENGDHRLTVRLHWFGVLLAQKVAVITPDAKMEWAHAEK